jgi:hypothetical protein
MKAIILFAAAIAIPCCHTSCTIETVRTITTDKAGTVTDVTTTRKGADPAAMKFAEVAAAAYAQRRPMRVRDGK